MSQDRYQDTLISITLIYNLFCMDHSADGRRHSILLLL